MVFLQWNCNGLIALNKIDPLIIVVQETKISPKRAFKLPVYIFLRRNRPRISNIPGPPTEAWDSLLKTTYIMKKLPFQHQT